MGIELYMGIERGGRRFIVISDCMNVGQRSINYNIAKSEEELLKHAAVALKLTDAEFEKDQYQNRIARERNEALEAILLHGQFHRDTKDV